LIRLVAWDTIVKLIQVKACLECMTFSYKKS